jgi:RNA polymerase sigma-70 factor (ECF subfamily)
MADDFTQVRSLRGKKRTPPPKPAAPGPDDSTLLAAARSGDARAFDALARRYRPRLFALGLHLTRSRSDAEDLAQEVLLSAYRRIDRFEGRSDFFTWLYRIAVNRAISRRRELQRRPVVSFEDERLRLALEVDAAGDPRRALELRESYQHLLTALDRLAPGLQAAVVLVAVHGLPHSEAAAVLDVPEGTLGWRVHEARRQMHATLQELSRDPHPQSARPLKHSQTRVKEGVATESQSASNVVPLSSRRNS